MRLEKILFTVVIVVLLSACGGGSSNSDDSGNSGEITNNAPTVNAGVDKSVKVNETITITGTANDSDGSIVAYEWREGSKFLANTATFDYLPIVAGNHTLTLTVTDDDGVTASDSVVVTVNSTLSNHSSKNHALQFDGATKQQKYVADRLDLGKLEGIAINSTDTFSISLYIHFDSFSKENPNLENSWENTSWSEQTIIGNYMGQPSGSGHFGVYITETDGVLYFGFNVSQIPRGKLVSYNLKELDKNILDYKMSFTFDGTIAKIYIDGEEVGSTIVGNIGGSANTANWAVGNTYNGELDDYRRTGDPAFKGVIDDIMFYNRALDGVEVQQLMNGIELTNGLVAKYDFEGLTPLTDKTGNGHDAQLTNTPTVIEWEY